MKRPPYREGTAVRYRSVLPLPYAGIIRIRFKGSSHGQMELSVPRHSPSGCDNGN
jgi:hypothetical protein